MATIPPPPPPQAGNNTTTAGATTTTTTPPVLTIVPREAYRDHILEKRLIEVGHDAVWSVSSAKHGNGVTQLRDDCDGTYWQSDDALPHTITIQFPKLTCVSALSIHLNAAVDESYTPKKIAVQCGTHSTNAVEVASADMENPDGWAVMNLSDGVAAMANVAALMANNNNAETTATAAAAAATSSTSSTRDSSATTTAPTIKPIPTNKAVLSAATITGGADNTITNDEACVWCTFINIVVSENHQHGRDAHVRGVHVYGPAPPKKYSTAYFASYDELR